MLFAYIELSNGKTGPDQTKSGVSRLFPGKQYEEKRLYKKNGNR
jgi:hypothetical protein